MVSEGFWRVRVGGEELVLEAGYLDPNPTGFFLGRGPDLDCEQAGIGVIARKSGVPKPKPRFVEVDEGKKSFFRLQYLGHA